mmetsp:Transcript_34819/g.111601  ORF Transcript_34819/g.111601 Transcript_34819/m.111601 type:complete len:227 (+) Transcript_34819:16-696(+)
MAMAAKTLLFFVAVIIARALGLVPVSSPPSPRLRQEVSLWSSYTQVASTEGEGLHGSNFCFLPLDQLDSDSLWPRLLRVAGAYPGLTSAELLATPGPVEAAKNGEWTYEFPDAHGSDLGVVAVPGGDLIQYASNPVAVVATAESLGLQLQNDAEALVVVDRGQTDFSEKSFFASADPDGALVIRRFDDSLPPGWTIHGKVLFVNLPFDPKTQAPSGTWLEEGDVSM